MVEHLSIQALRLKCQFGDPSNATLRVHTCPVTGTILQCCRASRGVLESVASANSSTGISDSLSYLQSKYTWGVRRCTYLCEAVEYANDADCGARTEVALELLSIHISYMIGLSRNGLIGIQLAHVQLILRCDGADVDLFKNDIDKMYSQKCSVSDISNLKLWLGSSCCYHRCVGLYTTASRHLRLWDFGEWFTLRSSLSGLPGSVLAIHVTPHSCGDDVGCRSTSSDLDHEEWMMWDGEQKLRCGQWVMVSDLTTPVNKTSHHEDSVSHTRKGLEILADIFASHLLKSNITHPLSPMIGMEPSPCGVESSTSTIPNTTIVVFISGCHMSANPGPGVGVARALRAGLNRPDSYSSMLHCEGRGARFSNVSPSCPTHSPYLELIAVDDIDSDIFSGLTDPCFDSCRSLILYNSFDERKGRGEACVGGGFNGSDDTRMSTLHIDQDNLSTEQHIENIGSRSENAMFWDAVVDMICPPQSYSNLQQGWRFFIPGRDKDVWMLAACMSETHDACCENYSCWNVARQKRYISACSRILSPSLTALRATCKPAIVGAVSMGRFQVPPYLVVSDHGIVQKRSASDKESSGLSDDSRSGSEEEGQRAKTTSVYWSDVMIEIHAFCESVGYPIMIKGARNGAMQCLSWSEVSSRISNWRCSRQDVSGSLGNNDDEAVEADLFLQKLVHGAEKTIAFAAVDGELTGCVMMTKYIHTIAGKVWGGAITPVDVETVRRLQTFLDETCWTGGGEIEFIESDLLEWFVIDFNPRLPAWIMASCFTGCNLPADLLAHAIARRGEVVIPFVPSGDYSKAYGQFTRSVIEVPQCNHAVRRQSQEGQSLVTVSKRAGGAGCITHSRSLVRKEETHSQAASDVDGSISETKSSDVSDISPLCSLTSSPVDPLMPSLGNRAEWIVRLCRAAGFVIENSSAGDKYATVATPCYVMCKHTIQDALIAHKSFVETAREVAGLSKSLNLTLCISVKTQPHPNVLKMALDAGYMAECISMAEVRSALASGFSSQFIILTGPGKFWEGRPNNDWRIRTSPQPLHLRAIFADSLSDLRTIIERVCDPNDWLSTSMVGIRFSPVCGSSSRFGLDSSDPAVLLVAAQLIKSLPASMHIAIHFHFASSGPLSGLPLWCSLVKGMATLAKNFEELCGRIIRVIDVGGGWSPSFIHQPDSTNNMAALLRRIYCEFVAANLKPHEVPLTIQFEPGKCLTERAGGIICRVLCIREISCVASAKSRRDHNDGDTWRSSMGDLFTTIRRAAIVDACVGDVSSPHVHPILWRPAQSRVSHSPGINSFCLSKGDESHEDRWSELEPGLDQIWGRSCMEFDVLTSGSGGTTSSAGICLPSSLREGDFVLIAATGAYDMSMQYDFADGIGRRCRFVNSM